MPDEFQIYQSDLTGPELDEALRNIGKVQQSVADAAQSAATAEQYGEIVQQNQQAIQEIHDNLTVIEAAPGNAQAAQTAATQAAASATQAAGSAADAAQSAQDAQDWADHAQEIANGALGWYADPAALRKAHPPGENGQWAVVGSTDTIWVWGRATDFTQVSWVGLDNTTITIPNFTMKATDSVRMKFGIDEIGNGEVFRNPNTTTEVRCAIGVTKDIFIAWFALNGTVIGNTPGDYTLSIDNFTVRREEDDTTVTFSDAYSDCEISPFRIGGNYSKTVRWYGFTVIRDGATVVDLVPAVDANGTPCMLERCSGTFCYLCRVLNI